MKKGLLIVATLIIVMMAAVPVYAETFDYSEETKRLMREAGMDPEPKEWDEINRRQIEYRNRINHKKQEVISSNSSGKNSQQTSGYGAKNSYDEFHTAPRDIKPNDGYKSGNFDEIHINENYRQDVWHPEDRGGRMEGFDEFHFPDEL